MPKYRLPLLALLSALLVTGCTTQVPGTPLAVPRPTKPKPPPTFTLVMPSTNDAAFQSIARAAQEYADQHKAKLQRVMTTGNPSTDASALMSAVQQKPTVLIAISVQLDRIITMAAQYREQKFLLLEGCIGGTPAANVLCTDMRDHEGVYLLGAEAGLLTTTGKVGAVVATNTIPPLKRYSVPFGQGAAAAKPGTTYQEAVVGGNGFNDPVRAGQAATSLGASHVMTSAFLGNPGVFQAAKAGGFAVFGMDVADCASGQGVVLDTLVRRMDVVVKDGLTAIEKGTLGQRRTYGLKENALSLGSLESDAQCGVTGKPEVLAKVRELREKIVSGELKIADPAAG